MTGSEVFPAKAASPVSCDAPLVLVVSSDVAVERSLVLLLEAEGISTCSFSSAAALLAALPALAPRLAASRHCLLVEEWLPGSEGGLELAGRLAAGGLGTPAVVLKRSLRPTGPRRPGGLPGGVTFADPFHMDALLQDIRRALRPRGLRGGRPR